MNLDAQIEGVLFYRAAPMKISALAKLFSIQEEAVRDAGETLKERLLGGATRLVMTETELELVTAPELDELIDGMRRDELRRDIGKAGAETLAIVLYRGPISRTDIDRIRGVNSSFILRNLMTRGLVARDQEGRQNVFSVTPALLSHLGLSQKNELPDYAQVLDTLEKFDAEVKEQTESV